MTTYSWLNAVNGDWSIGADWSPTGPANAATADAAIAIGGSYTVTIASNESFLVDSLTFGSASGGTLALDGTLTLGGALAEMTESSGTVDLAGTIAGGSVTLEGAGVLDDTGDGLITGTVLLDGGSVAIASGKTLTLPGAVGWNEGDVLGPGTLSTTGTTTISGEAFIDGGLIWINRGTVLDGGVIITGADGSTTTTVTNAAGGTFDLTSDNTVFQADAGSTTDFTNAGLLEKTVTTNTSAFDAVVTNTGTITASSGTLDLNDGGTLGGTIGATGTGEIAFGNGTFTLAGATQTITGTVGLAGGSVAIASGKTLTLPGAVGWNEGDALGPGTLSTTGTTTISSEAFIDGGLIWTNRGTVLDGGAIITGADGTTTATVTNAAGGTFDLTSDDTVFQADAGSTTGFTNAGLLEKTAATNTSAFNAVVTNTGTITASSGTLDLNDGGTLGGALTISAAGALEFGSGTFTVTGALTNGGVLALAGGLVTFAASAETIAHTVLLDGGSVAIASGKTLTLPGAVVWSDGDVLGPGTLSTTGTTTISSEAFVDGGLIWINRGTVLDGSAIITGADGTTTATVTNAAGGTFDLTSDDTVFQADAGSTTGFTNAGLLEKTAATNTSAFNAVVTNTGTITASSGTLDLNDGGTLGGALTISAAGALEFGSGTFTVTGALTNGGVLALAGGLVTFAASAETIAHTVLLDGGSVAIASGKTLTLPGAVGWNEGDVLGPGTLSTTGTTTISSEAFIDGGLIWTNRGTVLDGSAIITGADGTTTATVTNAAGGTFDLTSDDTVFQADAGSTTGFTNAGLLEKTAATNTSAFNAVVTNTGTITASSGTLDLNDGGTLGGALTISAAGALEFGSGTFTVTGALTNGGVLALAGGLVTFAASAETIAHTVLLDGGSVAIASGKTLTLPGAVGWNEGDVLGPGTLSTTGTTTISGEAFIDGGLIWINRGTVLDGSVIITGADGSTTTTVTNAAGGTFDLTSDNTVFQADAGSTTDFTNAGLLEKTATTNTSAFDAVVTNTGTITASSGTLDLNDGGTLGGTIGGTGTGEIAFGNGTFTLAGATQTITGTVGLAGGSVAIASGKTLTLPGAVGWNEGDALGPGTLSTTGTTTISSEAFIDGGLIWINRGTVLDGGAIITGADGTTTATVTNAAGGTFDLTSDNTVFQGDAGSTTDFTNAGLLEKTVTTNTSAFDAVVTNTGTITASSGTLDLNDGGTLGGTIGGTGSGVVLLAGGSFVTPGTAAILAAGATDDLQIVNGATWTDSGVIDDPGQIEIGNGIGTSALIITAAGSFDFPTDGSAVVTGGNNTLTNAGRIAKTGGTGTSNIGMPFTNTGTVDAANGTLRLGGGVGGTGRLQVEAGKTLELGSGGIAGGNTVDLNGLAATLKIDTNSTVAKPIIGLGAGSRIDLAAAASVTAVISGNTLAITPTGGSALDFVGTGSLANLHIGKASDGAGGTVVTLYNVAAASAHTPEPVAFANVHVGTPELQTLSVKNTAPANIYTENLDGTLATSATGFSATGSFSGLAGGATNASSLVVAINTATSGQKNGIATLTLASDGTGVDGLGKSALPTQTVNVTGAVYALALPVLSANTIALGATRVGGAALTGGITLGDGTSINAFQESLIYQFSPALPSSLSISNAAGTLVSGHTVAVGATLSTGTSGNFNLTNIGAGAPRVSFISTGAGTSGLANTTLIAPTLTVNGAVFATATTDLSAENINFGVVHKGDVVNLATLTVKNTATGALTDLLTAGATSETGSYSGTVGVFIGAGLAAGASGDITFGLPTSATGVQSGTVTLPQFSHDVALPNVTLAPAKITVTGTVDNFATAALKLLAGPAITGAAPTQVINLGTVQQNSGTRAVTLDVTNSATALADTLSGSFVIAAATGFTNSGFAAFSAVAAGGTSSSDSISLTTVNPGTFAETFTLHSSSVNTSSSTSLAAETLTVTGLVTPVYMLAATPTTIVATQNLDTFIAAAGVLNSHDSLTGGLGGGNTLELLGGGIFDLGAPKTLANIQLVNASEGQAAFVSNAGTIANTSQIVFLRDGLNVTLDVASPTPNPANLNHNSILIYGANDSSVINLGAGIDTVVLGSATEAVNGGGGIAQVEASIGFAGALVKGAATGSTTLEITTGGTATLNTNTTHATVTLDQKSVLTLSHAGFITAVGEVAGNTITAGAASQTLGGLAGGDKLVGFSGFGDIFSGLSAGLNGDTISGFGGTGGLADKIDLTDMAPSAVPGYSGNATQGTLTLSDGTHHASITMLGNFVQTGFHVVTDGQKGSFITYT